MLPSLFLFLLCLLICLGPLAEAASEPASSAPASSTESTPGPRWEDLRPSAEDSDWIQLDSKEWLRGELKVLRKDKIEFDSKELGLLKLDTDDVIQIITHDEKSIRIAGRGIYIGRIDLNHDELVVKMEDGQALQFTRYDIVSVAAGTAGRKIWDGNLSIGFNLSKGNTDQTELNAKFSARRRTPITRYKLDYVGIVSESEGHTISNNHRVTTSLDYYRSRHFFWRPFIGDLFIDTLQNIKYRVLLGAGLGYDIIDNNRTTWTIFCGPAFHYTKFDTVSEGEDSSEYSQAFIFSSEYEIELNRISDLELDYHGTVLNKKAGLYLHRFLASLKNEIIDDFDLDFTFIWDYIQEPQKDNDEKMPDKSDYKFMIGIGYSY